MTNIVPAVERFKHPIGAAVHEILWRDWDPISVNDIAPDDEYDGYVWPIIAKVMEGCSPEEIADYLDWASNEHMECPQDRSRNIEIARRLAALNPEL